jgi:predicted porin
MQKRFHALVLASSLAAAGTAMADTVEPAPTDTGTSVQIYGVADMFYGYYKQLGGQSVQTLTSGGAGGSRLGFKGAEDLGGGMKAFFLLENGFNMDTGTTGQGGRMFGRQAYVGLSGSLGALRAGRVQTPGYQFSSIQFDPIMLAPGSPMSMLGEEKRVWIVNPLTDPGRLDNSLQYMSNVMNGFQFGGLHGFGENVSGTTPTNKNINMLNMKYDNGPFSAAYIFATSSATTKTSAATVSTQEHALGLRYNLGFAELFTTYQLRKPDGYDRDNFWTVGTAIPITAATSFRLSYGKLNNGERNGTNATDVNWDVKSIGASLIHSLSKRTMIYAFGKRTENSGNAKQVVFVPGGLPAPTTLGATTWDFGVGIRHSF